MEHEDKKPTKKTAVSIIFWAIIVAGIIFAAYVGYNIFLAMKGLHHFFWGFGQLVKGFFDIMEITT